MPASLRDSEERFRTLVEYAPEALLIFDVDSGRFIDVNTNACQLFGRSRTELLTLGPVDVSPERQPDGSPSADTASAWIQETVAGKHSVFEWIHQDAGGNLIPCEVRLVRLPHRDRRWVRASIIDISERKKAEAERARLTAELAQAQKLQAIGQLTGGVAHDFNNLLTVILSSLEMIEAQADEPDRVRHFASQGTAAVNRASELTQRLLAFARRQPLRPRVVNANELLAGLESLLRRTLGETISIRTVFADDLWLCEVDPGQLENVIVNLAINARDAMPDGGYLTVETANARLERGYAGDKDEVEPGEYVMLAVSDNGTGMDPLVLNHVFEPFFTTKATGKGSGLGLATIYGFVKQSGGDVRIYSEVGQGTTVRVYLPRSLASAASEPVHPVPDDIPRGDGRTILVVEDDPAVRALVAVELESLGFRAVSAVDADGALETLAGTPRVDLVLTDVVLPGGRNGVELAREARALRPNLRLLFMSGYTENAIIHNGRLDPGVALLQKPFTRRELALALEAVLGSAPAGD